MSDLTDYALEDGVARITLDDGKVNALSSAMTGALSAALDRAEEDGAVVLLTGRATTFSAGFDLRTPLDGWPQMLEDGARLARRMLAFPQPVVIACNGNAVAMGAFLLLTGDVRLGTAGDFRIGLNEVAIGMTMPWFGVEIARHRLTAPYFDRCSITGALLDPDEAQSAGFLDRVVAADALQSAAQEAALQVAAVDRRAHAESKLRVRGRLLEALDEAIAAVEDEFRAAQG